MESSGGKERYGNDDRVDGGEPWEIAWGRAPVGRRAPLGRSDTEATIGWTGGETMGNSLGRALWGRSEMEATEKVDGGETVGNSMG